MVCACWRNLGAFPACRLGLVCILLLCSSRIVLQTRALNLLKAFRLVRRLLQPFAYWQCWQDMIYIVVYCVNNVIDHELRSKLKTLLKIPTFTSYTKRFAIGCRDHVTNYVSSDSY